VGINSIKQLGPMLSISMSPGLIQSRELTKPKMLLSYAMVNHTLTARITLLLDIT
jgi:hypothetical protein